METVTTVGHYLTFALALALAFAAGWWARHIWTSAEATAAPTPLREESLGELQESLEDAWAALLRLRFEADWQKRIAAREAVSNV